VSDKNNLPSIFNDSFFGFIKSFDSFFDESFQHFNTFLNQGALSVDFYETASDGVVEAKLPGYSKDQIQVEFVRNHQLRISVENSETAEVKNENNMYYHKKQTSQKLERLIMLPYPIAEEDAKATFKDGVLRIIFPKGTINRRFIDIE
jgi:HSP20 family protein